MVNEVLVRNAMTLAISFANQRYSFGRVFLVRSIDL